MRDPETRATPRLRPYIRLIALIGVIVPKALRRDWRQEWEAELRYRELLLADWDALDWRHKLDLFVRAFGAFWDALRLQPKRMEDEMFQDVRYGIRMALKNPGFTAVLVLTLGLGIGANAALFSVVNGVLLNPLPYPNSDQLVTLHQSKPNFETGAMPYPNFLDLQRENQTFSAMAISRGYGFTLIGAGEPERVNARLVTADFFSVLEIKPEQGRTFAPDEDQPGAAPQVVISHRLWQRKFGSSVDVLEKDVILDDKSYSVIGVLPSSFGLLRDVDVYVPIDQWRSPALQSRSAALGLHGIGRLKPGATIEQAEQDLNRIMAGLAIAYPATNKGNGAKLISLKARMVGGVQQILVMLLCAVGFVLLIACVNVSNLLLARSTARTREFAIRRALGAGRMRLVRQSLTESILLAVAGGALGLAIAGWGTRAALSLLPTALPRAEEVGLDARVLAFTIGISLITGILSGLAPAFKTSQRHVSEMLKEGGRAVIGRGVRAQGVLVAVEMALALVLLIGAGLMIRSLNALWRVDPGFRSENVLAFQLDLSPSMRSASPAAIRNTLRQLNDNIANTPGVRGVSFSAGALPLVNEDDLFYWIEGQPRPATQSEMKMALIYGVEPGYLTAMGIPLKRGRFFTEQDDERAPRVAVIDEAFAEKNFANDDPIGKRIYVGDDDPPLQIVGVVGHVRQWSLGSDDALSLQSQLYVPFRSMSDSEIRVSGIGVVVRTEGLSKGNIESIREAVQRQSGENVISAVQTMNQVISDTLARQRFSMILLGGFASVSLLLASIGIYGVISYLVGQRKHELGIRVALGAGRGDIFRLVISHGMRMAICGIGLGVLAALGLTRLMSQMLFGVHPTDPPTFAVIALVLLVVALAACYLPARRAMKLDPLEAIRTE
ncbi:MAG TPA: ABC transporter permease [Blastocatellia bacterium]